MEHCNGRRRGPDIAGSADRRDWQDRPVTAVSQYSSAPLTCCQDTADLGHRSARFGRFDLKPAAGSYDPASIPASSVYPSSRRHRHWIEPPKSETIEVVARATSTLHDGKNMIVLSEGHAVFVARTSVPYLLEKEAIFPIKIDAAPRIRR